MSAEKSLSRQTKEPISYNLLSLYRSELMGIAILWVMFFHAFDLDMGLGILDSIRSIGFGGVDIFIMLSSMGLVVSLSKKSQSIGAFMAKRASRILPAYFAVMIPYTLFLILVKDVPMSTLLWNSILLSYWVACVGAFNWYITGAMTFYIVTPATYKLFARSKHREILTALGIIICLVLSQLLIQDGYWKYTDIFYRIGSFIIGILLGFYVLEKKKISIKHFAFWSAFLLIGGGYAYYVLSISNKFLGLILPLCHMFIFTTMPMCIAIVLIFRFLPLGYLRKMLRILGENSLEIYLLNVSIFSENEMLHSIISFGPSNRLFYLIIFTLNITLGILLHKALKVVYARIARK